jgi:hypothetical protein
MILIKKPTFAIMKNTGTVKLRKLLVTGFSILILLLFSLSVASAQSATNFSGVWLQDSAKSDDFYKDFIVKCTIIQTSQTITIKNTFSDKSGKEMVTRENSFNLDGKELTSENGLAKKSARWSTDKKVLTTSDTRVYGTDKVGVTAVYTLSGNGNIMIVKTTDIKPGVKSITQFFNKQK